MNKPDAELASEAKEAATTTKTHATKKCRDCTRDIPAEARRCIHDNCGAFQDGRRFLGSDPSLVSIATCAGVIVSLALNGVQIANLAGKSAKADVDKIEKQVTDVADQIKQVKYFARLQAVIDFRNANIAYLDDASELINLNFEATESEQSDFERLLWHKHANAHDLGSYNRARNSFDAMNDLFERRLTDQRAKWERAMKGIYKLNDTTYVSRGSPTWKEKIDKDTIKDTKQAKGAKADFFESDRYKVPTVAFKEMVTDIGRVAVASIDNK